VTDFVNLKIKSGQSFRGTHRDKLYMCVFIDVSVRTCMSICVCTIFLKKSAYRARPSRGWAYDRLNCQAV
jgi:hypothetical protein